MNTYLQVALKSYKYMPGDFALTLRWDSQVFWPSKMAAAEMFWLLFLNNRSPIKSFFEISGPKIIIRVKKKIRTMTNAHAQNPILLVKVTNK